MKQIALKIFAIIGMLISVVGFWFYATVVINRNLAGCLFALFSLPFYAIDGIISLFKVKKGSNAVFNLVLSIIAFGSIPMLFCFGGSSCSPEPILCIYYLALFILELISVIHAIKMSRTSKAVNTDY